MRKKPQDTIDGANASGKTLLFTDLDLAHTMLQRAEVVSDGETRQRNIHNVERACASVQHFMSKLQPSEAERSALTRKVAALSKLKLIEEQVHQKNGLRILMNIAPVDPAVPSAGMPDTRPGPSQTRSNGQREGSSRGAAFQLSSGAVAMHYRRAP